MRGDRGGERKVWRKGEKREMERMGRERFKEGREKGGGEKREEERVEEGKGRKIGGQMVTLLVTSEDS